MMDAAGHDGLVWVRCADEPATLVEASAGDVVVLSRRAPGDGTRENEDSALVLELEGGALVLAVADGCGGIPGSGAASEAALRRLDAVLRGRSGPDVGSWDTMLAGFDEANEAVRGLGTGGATTLSVVVIDGGTARAFHAGDSMALICGQRGKLKHQAVPHSPTGYAVEAGVMSEREAVAHDERSLVSNVLGGADMRVEVGPRVSLAARDTVLVASDGLCDNLYTSEIVERVRAGDLRRGVAGLSEAASARMDAAGVGGIGHPDDLTVVAFRPRRGGGQG